MILISHRGNLNGREPDRENSPKFILEAVEAGFDVEIDLWCFGSNYFLGHDQPQYEIGVDWLRQLPVWCHAKNPNAFHKLLDDGLHCFWHQTDRYTLTSQGIVWCFPCNFHPKGITVVKESPLEYDLCSSVLGICTDHPKEWSGHTKTTR
jgi:hypothetical protein